MKRFIILIFLFGVLFSQKIKFEEKIEPSLFEKISKIKDDEFVNIVIYLGPYDYDFIYTLPTPEDRINYMKKVSYETQKPIVNFLIQKGWTDSLIQLWLANKIGVRVPKKGIFELLEKFPQIKYIYWNIKKVEPLPMNVEPLSNFFPGQDYVSGSVLNVKADEAWRRGYKGKGIIIGHLDTGVDVDHPILKNSYRGIQAWYDPINNTTTPNDPDGHGTGSLALALGSNGIGVAPGAKWIASNGIMGNATQLSQSMQWFAGLPDSLRPHLITNSWGSPTGSTTEWWDEIQGWLAVGIIPVFAIGNEGPNGSTTRSPGDYPMVFGIGGTWWPSEEIIWYSSRGPAPNQAPWNNTRWWPRPDWNRRKPDLIAPSEPTVTAAPNGEYQMFGGTSAACPHAAGVLALLLQANTFKNITSPGSDTARIRRIYRYMTDYAYWNPSWGNPSATPSLRDTFGWGRVDAEKYISNLPEPEVPHIFIDSVWVHSTDDGDKNIEPGERNVYIGIRLKNTGANAQSVSARLVYTSDANLTIASGGPFSYGNLQRGGTASVTSFRLRASTSLPQNTRIYFTLKITATGYVKHDFFYLDTWKQEEAAQTVSLRNDNDSPYWNPGNDNEYNNYTYFASRFEVANTGTMISCSIYCYNGAAAVTETLFVWAHNSAYNAPGDLIAYRLISVSANSEWKFFDIADIPGIPAGYIWVGVSKANLNEHGVPYQDDDGASTTNKSTNTRANPSSWTLENWWYDFVIRPQITYNAIQAPSIFYEGSYILDDSRYGNGDGGIDPGEQAYLAISLKNLGILAQNVVCTLKTADAFTQERIQIIKNVANFGDAPYGNPSTNNYNDPWIIRCWDEDSMRGTQDFSFIVKVVATYYRASPGSGGPYTYTTTLNFSISSPFIPYENTWWWMPSGVGPVYWYDVSASWYYHTDFYFGLKHPEDSFTIDSVYFGLYNSHPNQPRTATLRIRRAADPPNFAPTTTNLWSGTQSVPGNTYDWYFLRPNIKVPAWVWWHEYLPSGAAGGLEPLLRAPFVGSLTLVDATDGPPWADVGYFGYCLPFYFKLRHGHATISYYRPSNWSWPITPTNTRNSVTLPSVLNSWPDTTFVNFAILNRSGVDLPAPPSATARGPRGVWDNYLFLDNRGFWNVQINSALPAWNYGVAQNLYLEVPGGRHTLLIGLDWNNEVGGNVFNEYLRYWGMQFSWTSRDLYASNAPKRIRWVPDLTGPFAGPYYNVTVYACSLRISSIPGYGKPWHAVGIRNFNLTWDNDLDLRLYSDEPSDPYSGYTNVIEASELGPGKVDFIMVDGHHLGTKYYAGVYSFMSPENSPPDSTWMQFEMARYVITTSPTWNYVDDSFTDSTIFHVYDVIINNGQTFRCSLKTLSGTQDFGIALYGSSSEDRFKRRIDYLVASDVLAPGPETLRYTNTGPNDTFGLIVYGNLNASGNYRLKFTGTAQLLGIMEAQFSARLTDEGILLMWRDIVGAKKLYVEKLKGRDYGRIAEIKPYQNEFLDRDVENGKTYTYRLFIEFEKDYKILGPLSVTYFTPLPKVLTVLGINPMITRDKSILKIAVPKKEKIEISLYDVTGRISEKIFSGYLERGIYEFTIDKKSKGGIYFIVVKDKNRRIIKKVLFM